MGTRTARGSSERRWARSGPAIGLGLAVVMASLVAARVTPRALVPPPLRPGASIGTSAVHTTGPAYPRQATGADGDTVTIAGPPRRLISQDWAIDEFLYAIVRPERVIGVSESAYPRERSNVAEYAERYHPIVATDPERILLANPDLVLTPDYARSDIPGLLRRAGVPVYRMFTGFETLASIEEHIRLVGYLTGEDARATSVLDEFRRVIAQAAARRPAGRAAPRVLGLGGVYSYGTRTLFTDILRTLGATNVAVEHGFVGYDRVTDEHIVRWNPDWIVTGADRGTVEETRASLMARPAVAATNAARDGHVIVFENQVFLPISPFTARFVDLLSRALYGDGRS